MSTTKIPKFCQPFKGNFPVTFNFGQLPSDDSVKEKFLSWGWTGHVGIDFGLPEGTEVLSVDNGEVILSGLNGDYGISVIIKHSWGTSLYAHLCETKVSLNKKIKRGEIIGISGKTGSAFGPHLHFAIKPKNLNINNGYKGFINPNPYFK
jgi:murein DD-endopeptidase MepM/ murein hydrolase activator NlpD